MKIQYITTSLMRTVDACPVKIPLYEPHPTYFGTQFTIVEKILCFFFFEPRLPNSSTSLFLRLVPRKNLMRFVTINGSVQTGGTGSNFGVNNHSRRD